MFNTKRKFFKDKIVSVTKTMWDKEFKVSKARQIREGVRQDRDRAVEALQKVQAALKVSTDEAQKVELAKEEAGFTENIKRYESQMEMIDHQINGFPGTDVKEPVVGLLEELQSLAELKKMYKDYASKI